MIVDQELIYRLINQIHLSRFDLSNEKSTQAEIGKMFVTENIPFVAEYAFNSEDIVDFLVAGCIAVEVKIKGQRRSFYRQLERYAQHDIVSSIVLLTSVSMFLPDEINGKKSYVGSLSRGWL